MTTLDTKVKARFDRVNYTVPAAGRLGELGERSHRRAVRGDVITVEAEEADRLRALGAVVDVEQDVPAPEPDPFKVGMNPAEEVELSAGLTRGVLVDTNADGSGGTVIPTASPGPNASNREAVMAEARRRVEDMARAGHLGEGVTLIGPDGEPVLDEHNQPVSVVTAAPVTDAELDGMKVEELLAHLTQYPTDVDRVEAANGRRSRGASSQVTAAVEKVREAQAEQEDEAALAARSGDTGTSSAPTATSSGVETSTGQ